MTARPGLTPAAVAAALRLAADPDGLRPPPAEPGLRLRAHAVEALLLLDPALPPEAALQLAGITGPDAALAVASEMSGPGWDAALARRMAGLLRVLAPARGARVLLVPRSAIDLTAAACGDPTPGRSALDRRDALAARAAA